MYTIFNIQWVIWISYNLQGYQITARQASYTIHEFENEVITKDNIDELVYARRVKDNKMLTQVLIAASVVCFWWPFSLICLAAAYYTSEKVHQFMEYWFIASCYFYRYVLISLYSNTIQLFCYFGSLSVPHDLYIWPIVKFNHWELIFTYYSAGM